MWRYFGNQEEFFYAIIYAICESIQKTFYDI